MIAALLADPRVESAITLLAALSLATFVSSLFLIPLVVARLPEDCFLALHTGRRRPQGRGPLRILVLVLRNLFGALLGFLIGCGNLLVL